MSSRKLKDPHVSILKVSLINALKKALKIAIILRIVRYLATYNVAALESALITILYVRITYKVLLVRLYAITLVTKP